MLHRVGIRQRSRRKIVSCNSEYSIFGAAAIPTSYIHSFDFSDSSIKSVKRLHRQGDKRTQILGLSTGR
jgi:hypothetical protein